MFLGVDDIRVGMILNYQSENWPDKNSRWIILEQLRGTTHVDGKRFKMFCIKSSLWNAPDLNTSTDYTFHRGNIHRFTVHSQI